MHALIRSNCEIESIDYLGVLYGYCDAWKTAIYRDLRLARRSKSCIDMRKVRLAQITNTEIYPRVIFCATIQPQVHLVHLVVTKTGKEFRERLRTLRKKVSPLCVFIKECGVWGCVSGNRNFVCSSTKSYSNQLLLRLLRNGYWNRNYCVGDCVEETRVKAHGRKAKR